MDDAALPRFIDVEGRPLDLFEWAKLFEDTQRRILASDEWIGTNGVQYSLMTVWLGHNEPEFDAWPFGTAFRYAKDGFEETNYLTKEQALAGHARLLAHHQRKTGVQQQE